MVCRSWAPLRIDRFGGRPPAVWAFAGRAEDSAARNATALVPEKRLAWREKIELPVLVRRATCWRRAMVIAYEREHRAGIRRPSGADGPARPVLIDQFLEKRQKSMWMRWPMEQTWFRRNYEHIEEAGVHSGIPLACCRPLACHPRFSTPSVNIRNGWRCIEVVGLMNVQYAIQRDTVCLEVNPRAVAHGPFVSKATGVRWRKVAAR